MKRELFPCEHQHWVKLTSFRKKRLAPTAKNPFKHDWVQRVQCPFEYSLLNGLSTTVYWSICRVEKTPKVLLLIFSNLQGNQGTLITIYSISQQNIMATVLLISTLLSDFIGNPPFHYLANSSAVTTLKTKSKWMYCTFKVSFTISILILILFHVWNLSFIYSIYFIQ